MLGDYTSQITITTFRAEFVKYRISAAASIQPIISISTNTSNNIAASVSISNAMFSATPLAANVTKTNSESESDGHQARYSCFLLLPQGIPEPKRSATARTH